MGVVYFKRFRMKIDLRNFEFNEFQIPSGYRFHAWQSRLLYAHADAKSRSFRYELDANVFPSLADHEGCVKLMNEISHRQGFVPQATWLATFCNSETGVRENCATVQGIATQEDEGAIQNIGVTQIHRGMGIGSLLVKHCLRGFQQAEINNVFLEVTAQNTGAIRLYKRIGFQVVSTVYKIVEIPD